MAQATVSETPPPSLPPVRNAIIHARSGLALHFRGTQPSLQDTPFTPGVALYFRGKQTVTPALPYAVNRGKQTDSIEGVTHHRRRPRERQRPCEIRHSFIHSPLGCHGVTRVHCQHRRGWPQQCRSHSLAHPAQIERPTPGSPLEARGPTAVTEGVGSFHPPSSGAEQTHRSPPLPVRYAVYPRIATVTQGSTDRQTVLRAPVH